MRYYNMEEINKKHAPKWRLPVILTILSLGLSAGLFAWGVNATTENITKGIAAEESALVQEGEEAAHDTDLGNTLRESAVEEVIDGESIPAYTASQIRAMDVSVPSGVTVSDLKLVTRGNFRGLEEYFWKAEQDYGINCLFVMAIGANESAYGTRCFRKNNMFGFGGKGYATKAENIDVVARTLAKKYLTPGASLYKGKTVDAVHKRYAASPVWDDHVVNYMVRFYRIISAHHNEAIEALK
ncbi:MAG: glucosaminidase domain-containing protein [Firmicutes bacterium]|nr:glucosaminidase domain-containing protein [Bacillota bacterium]